MTRMIDVDLLIAEFEKVYPLATNEMGGVVNKKIYDIINSIPVVQESSPNNPAGDLISRDALRKEVTEKVNFTTVDGHIAYDKMLKLIDNAPTVEEVSVIEFKEPLPLVKAQKIVKALSKRPQGDLIRRSDALKAVDNRNEELLHHAEYRKKHCDIDLLGIKKHILAIPPVEARPQGEWIPMSTDSRGYSESFKCSICGAYIYPRCLVKELDYNGCPYCGAAMRTEDK